MDTVEKAYGQPLQVESGSLTLFKGCLSFYYNNFNYNGTGYPRTLIKVDCSNRQIVSVAQTYNSSNQHLYDTTQLASFNLSSNSIASIDFSYIFTKEYNSGLLTLDLSFNQLTNLSGYLFQSLPDLTDLNLSNNLITYIDVNAFWGLTNLQMLSLNSNKLNEFALNLNTFQFFNNLNYLDLSFNRFGSIQNTTFFGVNNLLNILIAHNLISDIQDNSFMTQKDLTNLDLGFNYLTAVKQSYFAGLKNLRTLSLESNQIQTYDVNMFSVLNSLTNLNVQNNPQALNYVKIQCN